MKGEEREIMKLFLEQYLSESKMRESEKELDDKGRVRG